MAASGAEGHLLSIVHPLTGNPQEQPADFFYVLAPKGRNLAEVFSERLALAIPWPTRSDWIGYLMEVGAEKERLRTELQVELIDMADINQAYQRMVKGDVKYRFVIDMKSLRN